MPPPEDTGTDMDTDTAMRREAPVVISLTCLVLAGFTPSSQAQMAPGTAAEPAIAAATAGAPAANAPTAEAEATTKRAWSIVPRLTITETLTDNALLRNDNKRSDQITQLSPGIRIDGEGARLKAHFDYARNELYYANDSKGQSSQNSLNAFGTLEAIEKWLFVDFSGVIARQSISAFGTQSASNVSVNSNQTETSNFRIAPYIRGKLAGIADYQLGYSRSSMHSRATTAFDVDTEEWSARIGGSTAFSNLGWSLEANRQEVDYSTGRRTESDRLRAVISYELLPHLKLSAIGGREANNYASVTKESHNTGGYGVDWSPSERTQLSAFRERRFFGDGHNFTFNHRTPLSAWRFTDSRDVAVMPNQLTTVGLGTVYDLFYNQLSSQFPDPTERARAATALVELLGIPANTVVTSGFLSSSASVQRRRELSFALLGARNTLTFLASQSESQRLSAVTGINDAFSNTPLIRQRGLTVTLAHRLSGLSSLNVSGSHMRSSGSSSTQDTTLRALNVMLSTKLGPRTSASLAGRHAVFDSTATPYTENALIGTLTAQF